VVQAAGMQELTCCDQAAVHGASLIWNLQELATAMQPTDRSADLETMLGTVLGTVLGAAGVGH